MSTTSAKSCRYNTGQENTSREYIDRNQNSIEQYKIGQDRGKSLPRQTPNEKILGELSSFIAEFSYLTDPSHNDPEQPRQRTPAQSFVVYRAGNDTNAFEKKRNSLTPYKSNNYNTNRKRRKKSVEFKEPVYYSKSYHDPSIIELSDTVIATSGEERPSDYRKRQKIPRDGRIEQHPKAFRSRDRNAYNSIRARPRKNRSRKSRSQSQQKLRRSQSNKDGFKITPLRRRRRRSPSSASSVRYWPFRYERKREIKRSRDRRHSRQPSSTKRQPMLVSERREVKELIPSEVPTLVTIFPKIQKKQKYIYYKPEPEFLKNQALPCKCFKCKSTYETLMKLSNGVHKDKEFYALQYPEKCIPEETVRAHSPGWCYHNGENMSLCTNKFEEHTITDCDEVGDRNTKSVYFKLNSYGQHIDSTITQYFHSILNETIYC